MLPWKKQLKGSASSQLTVSEGFQFSVTGKGVMAEQLLPLGVESVDQEAGRASQKREEDIIFEGLP